MIRNKNSKSIPVSDLLPIPSNIILRYHTHLLFHPLPFRWISDRISTRPNVSRPRRETSLPLLRKKKLADYRQIEILKFETCFHGNGGGQTFKPWRKIQLSEFSVSSGGDVKSGELRKLIRPILDDASLNIPKKTLDKIPNENEQKVQHFY